MYMDHGSSGKTRGYIVRWAPLGTHGLKINPHPTHLNAGRVESRPMGEISHPHPSGVKPAGARTYGSD
jgi:hypothetical protein